MLQQPFGITPVLGGLGRRTFSPDLEVKETNDAYVVCADVPGLDEKDIDVSIVGNTLTISGSREEEEVDENDRFYAYERSYGSFSRAFSMPEGADLEHADAKLDCGVLTLTIPKKPEVQPKRIAVGRGTAQRAEQVEAKEEKQAEKEKKAA